MALPQLGACTDFTVPGVLYAFFISASRLARSAESSQPSTPTPKSRPANTTGAVRILLSASTRTTTRDRKPHAVDLPSPSLVVKRCIKNVDTRPPFSGVFLMCARLVRKRPLKSQSSTMLLTLTVCYRLARRSGRYRDHLQDLTPSVCQPHDATHRM